MATYKVIQDIEAEDQLLGPLSLRQFLYAAIAVVALYLCYFFFSHGVTFLIVFPFPIALISGFFAFPWGRDQPTEVWALAKVRFLFKPHRRIWDQNGQKELVTITAPKKLDTHYTKDLTPQEVQSRLKALAETIDTRGWVTKNVNVNLFSPTQTPTSYTESSDRLVATQSIVPDIPDVDIRADEDILDERNNPTAQHFEQMIEQKQKEHREKLIEKTQRAIKGEDTKEPPKDYWFLNETDQPQKPQNGYATFGSRIVVPGTGDYASSTATAEELEAERRLKEQPLAPEPEVDYPSYIKVIEPPGHEGLVEDIARADRTAPAQPPSSILSSAAQQPPPQAPTPPPPPVTPPVNPVILNLASNNDRNVASIAREADNNVKQLEDSNDEVIISLH